MLYFDLATATLTRTVRLSNAFSDAEWSADGQYIYGSTIGDSHLPKNTPHVLEIVSLADGSVHERITLGNEPRWLREYIGAEWRPQLIVDAPGTSLARLLVLDGARKVEVPLPAATRVHVIGDVARNRFFVAAGRHLSEYSLLTSERTAQVALGADLNFRQNDQFLPSDDCSRILWIRGNSVRVVHTDTRTLLPAATVGTAGSKATQLLGEVAMNMVASAFGHPAHSLSVGSAAVFGTGATRAYVLASTGELATIDVATGRVTGHRPGGGRLIATPTLVLAVSPRSVQVIDRATGTTTQALALDTPADGRVVLASSADRTRLIVAGGSVVHIVDGATGSTVTTVKGLGRVTSGRFWD